MRAALGVRLVLGFSASGRAHTSTKEVRHATAGESPAPQPGQPQPTKGEPLTRQFPLGVLVGFTAGVLVATPPWAHRYLWIGAGLVLLVLVLVSARKARP